jgi:hypothetical protein
MIQSQEGDYFHVTILNMEIISKLVQIEANLPVVNDFIEKKLAEMGIKPLRWAVVGANGNVLTISLACENL